MQTDLDVNDQRVFEELQELVALELKDIFATATEEGYEVRDVVDALELALRAEIASLAKDPNAASAASEAQFSPSAGEAV